MPQAGLLGPPPHPRLAGSRGPASPQAGLVRDFKRAWEAKDIDALIGLLDPDATVTADGGGLVTAASTRSKAASRSRAPTSISPARYPA